MKRKIVVIAAILFLGCQPAQARWIYQRFSSNPIGALNVIGIGMSESADSANYFVSNILKNTMRITVGFPLYVDPSFKLLKAQAAVGFTMFGQSAGGAIYSSDLRALYNLGDLPFSIIVVDRNKRVRGFCDSATFEGDTMGRLLEELLLNIDNKEVVTVDDKIDKNYNETVLQTDAAKKREDKENEGKVVLDFGASKNKWFKYLGTTLPDCKLLKTDGKAVNLYDLIKGKATLIAVFVASPNPGSANMLPGLGACIMTVDGLYRDLALGEAKKGNKAMPNAFPDAVSAK